MKKEIKEVYTKPKTKQACTITITALEADDSGRINVEMNYEGDTCLAAYLLDDAKRYIDQKLEDELLAEHTPLQIVK